MAKYHSESTIIIKEIKKTEDIIDFLISFGEIDDDFNGYNGDEHLWECAKNAKCKTNAEYIAKKVVNDVNTIAAAAKYGMAAYTAAFVKEWLSADSYYDDMNIKLRKIDIPERTYTDDIQGTYAAYIIADYTD